jgi:predicted nucleic acid-binding protein
VRFVDTSFWVAYQFQRDQHHEDARLLWQGRAAQLLTTNHVLGETWTFLRRRLGHAEAVAFLDGARGSQRLTIVHVDEAIETEAWSWLHRHDERTYSFVDATSFAVMRRRGIDEALAFDGDFSAAGFIELRP